MADIFSLLSQLPVMAVTARKIAQFLFSVKEGDIPICHTRIIRVKQGLPWNEQIGAHPLPDGRLKLTPIHEAFVEAETTEYTKENFYKDSKKVSRKVKK